MLPRLLRRPGIYRAAAALGGVAALGAVALLLLDRRSDAPRLDRRVSAPLDSAAAAATSLIQSASVGPSSGATNEAAVAAGYLERQRLGIGGPFRLAEFALGDPLLSPTIRRGVAWLLVKRAYAGEGYELDSDVFRDISARDTLRADIRLAHLSLIERAVAAADDPRGGELAVRLAYQLAAAERALPSGVARHAMRLAAMARDRELARRDARALVSAARGARTDPLELMPSWRASLRFTVERPVWSRASWEARAVADAEQWLGMVRLIAADSLRSDSTRAGEHAARSAARRLPVHMAARLLAVSASARLAPQTAVVLATREHARRAAARGTTALRAMNEEALTAELSLRVNADDATALTAALDAATGLRAFAQERVWFPGDSGPSVRDLRRRYGYAEITFASDVPERWRPYLLRSLAAATADLHRALPPLAVKGARVHFVSRAPNDTLLALHVAQTRTVVLPVLTGSGTLAHELAHDLDARAGRTMYARGGYATDLAVRRQDGRMAASIAGLTRAPLVAGDGRPMPHRQRPAEVFARAVEWIVPASLARDGRSNGFLSSVQDEVLTGGGSVSPVDVSLGAVPVISDLLDEMPEADARAAAVGIRARFSGTSEWTASRIVRLVMETPLPSGTTGGVGDGWSFRDPTGSLESSLPAQATTCSAVRGARPPAWRDELLRAAVDARLRGIARSRARRNASGAAPVARFVGLAGPWDDTAAETFVERARQAMLVRIYNRVSSAPSFAATLEGEPSAPVCARR